MLDAYYSGAATNEAATKAEDAAGELAAAHADAINDMALVPAPTFAALHYKIRTAHDDGLFDASQTADEAIEAIIADVRRLGAN